MAKAKGNVAYNTFIAGLVTEATEINFPPNASLDEQNMVLSRKGSRRRRLGVDYVSGYALSADTFPVPDNSTGGQFMYYLWKAVAGDGTKNFLVFQIKSKLYFYDQSNLASVGSITLSTYAIAGATNVDRDKVRVVSTRGKLFVVGRQLQPFFITYAASTLTVTSISFKIRDLAGLNDTLADDFHPTTLSAAHHYNILNQGWSDDPNHPQTEQAGSSTIQQFFDYGDFAYGFGDYPANTDVWWLGKDPNGFFDRSYMDSHAFGNTTAPKGHYTLDPFVMDRTTASGIAGIANEAVTTRPQSIEAFAGRIWYAGVAEDKLVSNVYFSQVINSNFTNIGNCYQLADPTSEADNVLVATDGGVIPIAKAGGISFMLASSDTLFCFAANGVWAITGSAGAGFSADDFTVYQVSDVGLYGVDSVREVEGSIFYWAQQGIYVLSRDSVSGKFQQTSLVEKTIQTLYNDIPNESKQTVQVIYDIKRKQISWLYNGTAADVTYRRNKKLIFDIGIGAFSQYIIQPLASNSPYIIGAVDYETTTSWFNTSIAFLTIVPGGGTYKFTFSALRNTAFLDWYTSNSTGISYDSYLETGYEYAQDILRNKELVYILCYFAKTETGWVLNAGTGGYDLVSPSSCKFRTKWDFTNSTTSNRWSREVEAYRFNRLTLPDTGDLTIKDGFSVIVTKNKVRGEGRALRFRFSSSTSKDLHILGWAANYTGETDV